MSSANQFGSRFVLSTFGESHGPAMGAVIDGVPAGIPWDDSLLRSELARRRPGSSTWVSPRSESDEFEVLSGVYENITLGTPIAVVVRNRDARPGDYLQIAAHPRTGHADDVWKEKFGHSDPRGGGRSSGRETLSRVIGGSVARMFLDNSLAGYRVTSFAKAIGPLQILEADYSALDHNHKPYPADDFVARFPSPSQQTAVEDLLSEAKKTGLSYGGIAEVWIDGLPAGLGQPVFRKLKAALADASMGVGAACGFEFGAGLSSSSEQGSEFHRRDSSVYGGIRGGISTGERIVYRVFFKPTSSVLDVARLGRHDPCIVPRALPVLEAMAHLTIADQVLWARGDQLTSAR